MAYALPAWAQDDDMSLLRDTETEEMLRSYETPLARAAGLDPVPKVWLIQRPDQRLCFLWRRRRKHLHFLRHSSVAAHAQ